MSPCPLSPEPVEGRFALRGADFDKLSPDGLLDHNMGVQAAKNA